MNRNAHENTAGMAIPRGVLALAAIVGCIELLFSLGGLGMGISVNEVNWRAIAIHDHGLWLPLFDPGPSAEESVTRSLARLITYPFVDYSLVSSIFGVVFILAMGKFISSYLNQVQVVAIFLASSVLGGICYGVFYSGTLPLLGASPGFFGFFGGVFIVALLPVDTGNLDRRALLTMPLFLIGLQIVLGLLVGGQSFWIADLGGFLAGAAGTVIAMFGVVKGFYIIVELLFSRNRN